MLRLSKATQYHHHGMWERFLLLLRDVLTGSRSIAKTTLRIPPILSGEIIFRCSKAHLERNSLKRFSEILPSIISCQVTVCNNSLIQGVFSSCGELMIPSVHQNGIMGEEIG